MHRREGHIGETADLSHFFLTPVLLLCPRQTPCAQHPPLLRCSTRPASRTLTEAHTSMRSSVFRGTHLRMSGGKACGKQASQYTGKKPDKGVTRGVL